MQGVEVRLGVNYFEARELWNGKAEKLLFTGCIDEFFDYRFGQLDYRSLRFEHRQLPMANFQGNAVVNYTEAEVPYTRIIEHKHFEFGNQPSTVVTYEYPDTFAPGKEPYYPVNDEANTARLKQYKALAAAEPNVLFGGRLGQYVYADMDDTIEAAWQLAQKELASSNHL